MPTDCTHLALSETMNPDWVNRTGIILNFFAGFMLAPELIGVDRLIRFEKWLETKIQSQLKRIEQVCARVEEALGGPLYPFSLDLSARNKAIGILVLSVLSVLFWLLLIYVLIHVGL